MASKRAAQARNDDRDRCPYTSANLCVLLLLFGAVSSVAISANERTWDQLPDEVRRALLTAAEVYRDELAVETVRRSTRAMESFEALGGSIVSLSDEQRREWAASVPDLAGAWVADIERRGLPGRELLREYMNTMRANDQPIMRHWDRE